MTCNHSLYFKYEEDMVGCVFGCGYKAKAEVALTEIEPSTRVVPVRIGVDDPRESGLMITTDQGYMGVITGCLAGVLYVEKLTNATEVREAFEKLVAKALGVSFVHDGENLSLIKK